MPVMDEKESLPLASSAHEASPIDFDPNLKIKDAEGFLEYDENKIKADATKDWSDPPKWICDYGKVE